MYELKKMLERYLQVNLLGPGRGLTKIEKHWSKVCSSVLTLTLFFTDINVGRSHNFYCFHCASVASDLTGSLTVNLRTHLVLNDS
jgi:hypothetical protein